MRGRADGSQRTLTVARQRADHRLQPRALVGLGGADPAPRPGGEVLPRADRAERAAQRVAAVGEHPQPARAVAADAQLLDRRARRGSRARAVRVAVGAPASATTRTPGCGRATGRGGRGGGPIGPWRQRSSSAGTCSAAARAQQDVEAVARAQARRAARRDRLVAAHDHVDHRVARQAEVAHRARRRSRRSAAIGYSSTSAPRRRIVPASTSGRGSAGWFVVIPSRSREALERRALQQRREQRRRRRRC